MLAHKNVVWLSLEKATRLSLGILTTVVLVRYLGSGNYGILALAVSIYTIFGHFAVSAIDQIIIHEIIKDSNKSIFNIINYATCKLIYALIAEAFFIIFLVFIFNYGAEVFWVSLILSMRFVLFPLYLVDAYFEGNSELGFVAIARVVSFTISSIGKIVSAMNGSGIEVIAAWNFFEGVIGAQLLLKFYTKRFGRINYTSIQWKKVRDLLLRSLPVFISSSVYIINTQLDKLMLGIYCDKECVGEYALASQFVQYTALIPALVVAAYLPRILKLYDQNSLIYKKSMAKIKAILISASVGIILFTGIFASSLILYAFGKDMSDSVDLLIILSFSTPFMFLQILRTRLLIANGMESLDAKMQIVNLVIFILAYSFASPLGHANGVAATYTIVTAFSFLALPFLFGYRPFALIK